MQVFLETARLVLRRFTEDDVDNLVELDSDPDVMRFINGGRPTPRDEIESDVLPYFLGYYQRFAGYGFWAAIEKSTGQFVGWFHFRPAADANPDEVELGYRLRKSAWGKGYATEGSRALIEKGFADLGVRRVTASTMVVNAASRRVMEKAGLKFVRTFHQPWPDHIEGEEEGDVEYALLRSEWEPRARSGDRSRRRDGQRARATHRSTSSGLPWLEHLLPPGQSLASEPPRNPGVLQSSQAEAGRRVEASAGVSRRRSRLPVGRVWCCVGALSALARACYRLVGGALGRVVIRR